MTQSLKLLFGREENIVGKEKILDRGYQHFLLPAQYCKKFSSFRLLHFWIVWYMVKEFPYK